MALSPDVAIAVSIWVEAVLYGVYACLFLEAFYIMLRKQSCGMSSAKVFLVGTLAMFLVATADMVVNLYRFLRGFVFDIDPAGPFSYFFNFQRWDNLAHNSMLCIMTWLGDALVIYRCYVIWDRQIWVTVIPVILLLLSIATNAALFFWFTHPNIESPAGVAHWMGTIYPFAFAQNIITTGMIAFKIWRQHRRSMDSGVISQSPLDLLTIMRIIIESAMIYTLQLLILIILFPIHELAQLIVQNAVIPSIGIIFVLIAVRVHLSRAIPVFGPTALPSFPLWLPAISGSTSHRTASPQHSSATAAGTAVVEAPLAARQPSQEFGEDIAKTSTSVLSHSSRPRSKPTSSAP